MKHLYTYFFFFVTSKFSCSSLLFILLVFNTYYSLAGIEVKTTDITGCNKNDGTATITITDVGGIYQYALNGGNFSESNTFTGLAVGDYTVIIRDIETKCEYSKGFTIKEANKDVLKVIISGLGTTTFCDNSNPSVTLTAIASGGSGNYEYSWLGGALTVSTTGSYLVTVKDIETGCTASVGGDVFFVPIVCSRDPNDIIGPEGYGPGKMISKFEVQPYKIRFENDPKFATAPAQIVRITHPLDPNVNIYSFRLGSFGFGPFVFMVPENKTFYITRVDVVDALGVVVDVTAGIDVTKKEAFWIFESKDPKTGLAPSDASLGFLAINDSTGIGEGYVSYTIKASNETVTGDLIHAKASIIFDDNAPLETPEIFNTIDAVSPASKVQPLLATENTNTIKVDWSGQDDAQGSGVRSYSLYVSEDGGPFTAYQSGITEAFTTFTGKYGSKYGFYTRATDNVGNEEPPKQNPEASVVLKGRTLTITGLTDQSLCQNTSSSPFAFAVMDGSSTASGASISVVSSNATLVSSSNIVIGGTGESPTITVTPVTGQTGTTTLTVKAITSDGGSGEATFILTVQAIPQLIVTNPPAACAPNTVNITTTFTDQANLEGTISYWKDALATVSLDNPDAVSESGTYYIKKTAAISGCTDIKPVAVIITPVFNIDAGPEQTVSIEVPRITLTGFSPDGGVWSGNGVSVNGVFTPSISGVGIHTLTYTVTQNGCTFSDERVIRVTSGQNVPLITRFTPTSGQSGALVNIYGSNLTGATAVNFNGISASSFTVISDTEITATVPSGATTGKISVVTPAGTATSADDFTIQSVTTPVITWVTPQLITYGTALSAIQLNATANVAGTFEYIPAAGTVLNAGEHTLSLTFTPDDQVNYTTASKSVTITVNKATPVITWSAPAGIAEGTALSDTQLNATASFNGNSVPGTFTYTPTAGTMLPAGNDQELSVAFVPQDKTNYNGVPETKVKITVNGAPVLTVSGSTQVNEGALLTRLSNATDVNGDAITYSLVGTVPDGANIDPTTGTVTWTPSESQGPGQYTVTVRVTDNGSPAMYDEESATITVLEVNEKPVLATVGNKAIAAGLLLTFTLSATDADIPQQSLQYSASSLPDGASLNSTSGEFSWMPAANQVGTYQIIFGVTDGLLTAEETITITVTTPDVGVSPLITAISPNSGPVGTVVSISGSNFTGVRGVAFNGIEATVYTVDNASSITATVPNGATTGYVSVATSNGTAVSKQRFTVTVLQPPSISSFKPSSGPIGTEVTISGKNFLVPTTVSFAGVTATEVTVLSPTSLTARVPAGARTGAIRVSTSGGSDTSKKNFTVTGSLAASQVSSPQALQIADDPNLIAYPNPFTGATKVRFALKEDGAYTLALYDVKGALVRLVKAGEAIAGERYEVEVDGKGLSIGTYLLRLQSKEGMQTIRLVFEK